MSEYLSYMPVIHIYLINEHYATSMWKKIYVKMNLNYGSLNNKLGLRVSIFRNIFK